MSQSTIALTLGDITVRQHNGLFSLNDLHKASGGNPGQRPGEFMRNQQTKELVEEISNAGISAFESRKGNNGGTYACRELVIAYAAWISAAFHLKVIRVFLAVAAPQPEQMRLDYDRISPAQKQDLKEIVDAIVKAGIQTYGETWKRLQHKFRVNKYEELPATQHLEARQYLIAKLPSGYSDQLAGNEDLNDEQEAQLEKQPPLDWTPYIPSYVPLPSEVQVALDDKAWQLAAQAYKIIHQHLRFSVNYSCAVGHPERQIDQPEALKLIEKTILDDALVPFQPELTYLVTLSDAIADSAAKYAQAVRDGVHAVRARGGLLGPVLRASRPELKPYPYAKD